ncbi:MAG: hypothetical protein L6R38_005365 [Xanthoria sp. 2 TBL-2021]|nr:MAG: hypothetical protein L6R38_005365 [Xanthoria sp. 2 TBL-2021]
MPKQKQFLKSQRKPTKPKNTIPQTANEFLAVGVDLEEAGEKWRAGDAQKSARFFLRALDAYENGLQHFRGPFDLAYNRYALEISQENADLLFNTGQVLTSLGELISEERYRHHDAVVVDPLGLFQEALTFFQRCFSLQELQFSQLDLAPQGQSLEADRNATETTSKDLSEHPRPVPQPSDEDTWATIMEPVTDQALMDTLLAQAETLTSICGLSSIRGIGDPNWIDEYYRNSLHDKLLGFAKETGRHHEAALAKAKYRCTLADANFTATMLDIPTYEKELMGAYQIFPDSDPDPQALCDRADAEIVFAASVQKVWRQVMERSPVESMPEDGARLSIIRWKHLTKALDNLTVAGKLPNAKNLPRIHLRRGDCELLRRRLGAAPLNYDIALKSALTLLKNAEIYYRGAARLAKAEAAADEEAEASIKEAVVIAVSTGDHSKLHERLDLQRARAQEIIEDMNEEGLLWEEDMKSFSF